ncbi:MAG: hypothetical protein SGJ23_15860 [Alphaproteobacteria bacterium]|nr:hypothetical protein [Alphaproteobacteria bacterium]
METQTEDVDRRVYRPELSRRLGLSTEWIRQLERKGRIARARYDEGSRRGFWLETEVRAIVAGGSPKNP